MKEGQQGPVGTWHRSKKPSRPGIDLTSDERCSQVEPHDSGGVYRSKRPNVNTFLQFSLTILLIKNRQGFCDISASRGRKG